MNLYLITRVEVQLRISRMGTPAKTFVYDEDGDLLVCFYRQSDGYPDCHGRALKKFCADYTIVNGIKEDLAKTANGMGDFAAQIVTHFKAQCPIGGIYILTPKTMKEWIADYEYSIKFKDGKLKLKTETT